MSFQIIEALVEAFIQLYFSRAFIVKPSCFGTNELIGVGVVATLTAAGNNYIHFCLEGTM